MCCEEIARTQNPYDLLVGTYHMVVASPHASCLPQALTTIQYAKKYARYRRVRHRRHQSPPSLIVSLSRCYSYCVTKSIQSPLLSSRRSEMMRDALSPQPARLKPSGPSCVAA